MRLPILTVTPALLSTACATMSPATLGDRTLPYGCNDTVVVGTVRNGAYEAIPNNDILGQGWISATLHVRKVLRGGALPGFLPVRYSAHTYIRQDQDFMLVLKHSGAGYEITTGQLMRLRPLLASRCQRMSAMGGKRTLAAKLRWPPSYRPSACARLDPLSALQREDRPKSRRLSETVDRPSRVRCSRAHNGQAERQLERQT